MNFTIKALTPAIMDDYFDFFDNRAFSDGSPYYPCYCNAFNLRNEQIKVLLAQSEARGGGTENWKEVLRDSAMQMVCDGIIHGYLAYDGDLSIGWCNANDRLNYYRVGEFDLDNIPEDTAPIDCPKKGYIKSIVCFEISPAYRGMGIAGKLLEQVCKDAAKEGYSFAEAYPKDESGVDMLSFTGPLRLYQKAGFREHARSGSTIIMRKALK